MPSKNSVNNKNVQKDLEKKISPVLVVNNSSLKPYVELFEYAPENIYQQPLGSLVGFFEIKEYSEDSAYIVNFLTSVLKKEYYINPKRTVEESLDSALHKVNVALSELAKHGNVQWLGNLHAAICVLEKNNAHFSVAGNAKLFLFRNNVLSEISQDLASDSTEPHPLKTFVNVSSGQLEKDDHLLITSEDIFHILPFTELKKNFQRFAGDKFVQFLKTALSNQMEMIASVVVEVATAQTEKSKKIAKKKAADISNVFSEKTFIPAPQEHQTIEEALQSSQTQEENQEDYVDKKTGHIYIQGQNEEIEEISKAGLYWELTKGKVSEGWYALKNNNRRRYSLAKKNVGKYLEQRQAEKVRLAEKRAQEAAEEAKRLEEERVLLEIQKQQQLAVEREQQRILQEQAAEQAKIAAQNVAPKVSRKISPKIVTETKTEAPRELSFSEKLRLAKESIEEEAENPEPVLSFQEKLKMAQQAQVQKSAVIDLRRKTQIIQSTEDLIKEEENDELNDGPVKVNLVEAEPFVQKAKRISQTIWAKTRTQAIATWQKTAAFTQEYIQKRKTQHQEKALDPEKQTHLAPRFSKIKYVWHTFSSKQKLYALGGFVLVFIAPLFIVHWMNQPKPKTITQLQTVQEVSPEQKLASEKNINLSPKEQTVLPRTDIVSVLETNAGPVAVTKNSVILAASGSKEYPITSGEGNVTKATFMNDLSLVLLLTDQNKVISFSPTSLKFTDNNISFPGSIQNAFLGTYLTYLYVLDPSANQIFRYPRADGGFGDKTNWYKDTQSLANVSDMTMDENIYCVQNNQLFKLFKGQEQPLKLESATVPVVFSKIFTTLDSKSLYVLDTQNTRLVVYNKSDGSIIAQYFDENLKNANSFAVDEQNKLAYLITSSGLISLGL